MRHEILANMFENLFYSIHNHTADCDEWVWLQAFAFPNNQLDLQ